MALREGIDLDPHGVTPQFDVLDGSEIHRPAPDPQAPTGLGIDQTDREETDDSIRPANRF